jgi:hypothetical protein
MESQFPQSEPPPVATLALADDAASTDPSGQLRFAWILAGVVLPPICFAIGYPDQPSAVRSASEYAAVLLSRTVSAPVYPLLSTCIAGLGCLAWNPARFRANRWVRLGVYSGVVLSVEYWGVFQVAVSSQFGGHFSAMASEMLWGVIGSCFAVAVPWYFGRMVTFVSTTPKRDFRYGCAITILIMLLLGAALSLPWSLVAVIALSLLSSTPWAVAAYVSAAIWLVRHRKGPALQYTLWQLLAAMTWLAVHFAAWRMAVLMMLARVK